jgi:hypothetical protein
MLVEEEAEDHPISDVPMTIGQRACVPVAQSSETVHATKPIAAQKRL